MTATRNLCQRQEQRMKSEAPVLALIRSVTSKLRGVFRIYELRRPGRVPGAQTSDNMTRVGGVGWWLMAT